MANIADTAGIFTGGTLELFNEMERLVLRDGDVAHAQAEVNDAMRRVAAATATSTAGSGKTITRRKP
jgi:hypothetical protein